MQADSATTLRSRALSRGATAREQSGSRIIVDPDGSTALQYQAEIDARAREEQAVSPSRSNVAQPKGPHQITQTLFGDWLHVNLTAIVLVIFTVTWAWLSYIDAAYTPRDPNYSKLKWLGSCATPVQHGRLGRFYTGTITSDTF